MTSAAFTSADRPGEERSVDVVVVGAGFAGLYLLHSLRRLGFSAVVLEQAGDVGGTWYWNRYPGARCDIESVDYSYSFDPELQRTWQWSERYATQPEILRYLGHVADRHDLRRDIRFNTRVEAAEWDGDSQRWRVRTAAGDRFHCRFYVMATGCLSLPKTADIPGVERFRGATYYTGRWPHEGVDFRGKRVAVIGTGSSGVQSIPIIAEQAAELTVFQRTPNFSRPAFNGPVSVEKKGRFDSDPGSYREEGRWSRIGVPSVPTTVRAFQVSEEERRAAFEAAWQSGDLLAMGSTFADLGSNPEANEAACEFLREKIRSIVRDPATAETLTPRDHYYGTKRPCLDSGYFETFNRPNVGLVDLRREPITTINETGIETRTRRFEFDAIVFAVGFDAMTGPLLAVDVTGRTGTTLARKWTGGPRTYLGVMTTGFPNFFMVTGPGSPSVLSNMVVSIEQHVDWITACLDYMRREGLEVVEPTPTAEDAWVQHVNDAADITLYPRAASWYMGANVPGKPRVFLPYVGGVDRYRQIVDDVVARDYLGFSFEGPGGRRCRDGVAQRLQLDATMLIEAIDEMALPPMETLSVPEARARLRLLAEDRPPGPKVGDVRDGELPGAAGMLAYRRYQPPTPGPYPLVVYFHGGGFVLGDLDSDDPFCRDLCVRSDAVVVSVNYRHAPEAPLPAAAEDAFAALQWIAAHAAQLGGIPGRLAVAGWSSGGGLAALVCRKAREAGGPAIAGQVLITPLLDWDEEQPSHEENAEGYVLTRALLHWFRGHYRGAAGHPTPADSPLRAGNLRALPPALILTAEFDPLRDQGIAYAEALRSAGVPVEHVAGRGQIHQSFTAVDVILSANPAREQIAAALRHFLAP